MRIIARASFAALAAVSMVVGSAHAQRVLERLEEKQFGQPKQPLVVDPSRKGKEAEKPAERGYLGVITDEGADKGRGVRVIEVVKGSPAEDAGLKVGDLITAIAETPIRQTTDVPAATKGAGPGTKLGITVVRDGAMRTILVTLGRRPDDSKLPPAPPDRPPGTGAPPPEPQPPAEPPQPGRPPAGVGSVAPPRLGVMMQSYSEDPRLVLGRAPIRGVQVLEVLANTPASAAGFRAGDIIVAVGGAAVNETQELRDNLAARRAGEEVDVSYYRGRTMYRQKVRLAAATAGDPPIPAPPAVVGPGGALPRETSDQQRIESLERRVRELERRLNELERKAEKPVPPPGKE